MYIFVSNIGCSGAKFITKILRTCTRVPAYNSLPPHCNGKIFLEYNNYIANHLQNNSTNHLQPQLEEIEFFPEMMEKIIAIKNHQDNGLFYEGSPIFLRGYSKMALSYLSDVKIIHLTRDPIENAQVLLSHKSVP